MRKIAVMGLILIIVALLPMAAAGDSGRIRIFLEFNGKADKNIVEGYGGKVLYTYETIPNIIAAEIPEKALKGILKNPNLVGYELDGMAFALGKPAAAGKPSKDPVQPLQVLPWGIGRIDAELSPYTGEGIEVCVVDTGIDKDHPDLIENINGGKNFVVIRGRLDPARWDDDNGHGTHVSGTIAASDNAIGVVGAAPEAGLRAAKVLDKSGAGYLSAVAAGIDYCVSSGSEIISLSLGGPYSSVIETAVNNAYSSGILVVAAAGNEAGEVLYPAAFPSVIAVSATDSSDNIASWSNFGPKIELAAPGVGILSTMKGGGYEAWSGTSMAAPHVSGVSALAWQAYPGYSNVQIRELLQNNAMDIGPEGKDDYYGYGLVYALFD